MDPYAARSKRPYSKFVLLLHLFVVRGMVNQTAPIARRVLRGVFRAVSYESFVSVLVKNFHDGDYRAHTLSCIPRGNLDSDKISRSPASPIVGDSAWIARRVGKGYDFRSEEH